jgi:hypothetical protein
LILKAQYEWLNNLYLFGRFMKTNINPVGSAAVVNQQFTLGMSYGL